MYATLPVCLGTIHSALCTCTRAWYQSQHLLPLAGDVIDQSPRLVCLSEDILGLEPKVGSMLTHRLRRWPNIEPTLGERLVFAG